MYIKLTSDKLNYISDLDRNYVIMEFKYSNLKVLDSSEIRSIEYSGIDYLKKIKLGYTAVLYCTRKKKVIIVQDKLKKKQLFYKLSKGELIVASDLNCFRESKSSINLLHSLCLNQSTSLQLFNEVNNCKPKETILNNVFELPWFHFGEVNVSNGTINFALLWDIKEDSKKYARLSEKEIIREYDHFLTKEIEDTYNISISNSTGLLYSGGIDSTIIKIKCDGIFGCKTFSKSNILNLGELYSGLGIKENNLLNESCFYVFNDYLDLSIEGWKNLVWNLEYFDISFLNVSKYYLISAIKHYNSEINQLFSGLGSDQFNGGVITTLYDSKNKRKNWDNYLLWYKKKYLNRKLEYEWNERFEKYLKTSRVNQITTGKADHWKIQILSNLDVFSRKYFRIEDNIAKYNGINLVCPFYTKDILELCYGVSPRLQFKLFYNKNILRNAPTINLYEKFKLQRKQNINVKIQSDPFAENIFNLFTKNNCLLLDEAIETNNFFDRDMIVRCLYDYQRSKNFNYLYEVLPLLNIGLYNSMISCKTENKDVLFEEKYVTQINANNKSWEEVSKLILKTMSEVVKQENVLYISNENSKLYLSQNVSLLSDEDSKLYIINQGNLVYEVDDNFMKSLLKSIKNNNKTNASLGEIFSSISKKKPSKKIYSYINQLIKDKIVYPEETNVNIAKNE